MPACTSDSSIVYTFPTSQEKIQSRALPESSVKDALFTLLFHNAYFSLNCYDHLFL